MANNIKAADAALAKAGLIGKGTPLNGTMCGNFIRKAGEADYAEGYRVGNSRSYAGAYNKAYDRALFTVGGKVNSKLKV